MNSKAPSLSSDSLKAGMATANALFHSEVFASKNFEAIDRIYTADARILPPGAPMISGRAAIKEFWSGMIASTHATGVSLVSDEVILSGDGAVELGHATLTLEPPGQSAVHVEAKYVVFWREEDGAWKWHIDIWNSNS